MWLLLVPQASVFRNTSAVCRRPTREEGVSRFLQTAEVLLRFFLTPFARGHAL